MALEKILYNVIDISHWNGKINWCTVANKGIKGAILKCGGSETGSVYQDKLFEDYYIQSKNHGLYVGAYFFGYGNTYTKGCNDALAFREMLKGKQFDLPVYLDYESPNNKDNVHGNTEYIRGFCHTLETFGYFVGIYGSDYSTFIDLAYKNKLSDYSWWVAKYSEKPPKYAVENCHMWQYSSSYIIDGVKTDISHCYVDFPKIIKSRCLNGY